MNSKIALEDAQRSGIGMCLFAPQYLKEQNFSKPVILFARAALNVAVYAAAPLGAIVSLGRAGKAGIGVFQLRKNEEKKTEYMALKKDLATNLAFAGLDVAVAVSLFVLSWKVLAVVVIARQIKPDYAVIAYKKFTLLVIGRTEDGDGIRVSAG